MLFVMEVDVLLSPVKIGLNGIGAVMIASENFSHLR
jgi:hypothetical protein